MYFMYYKCNFKCPLIINYRDINEAWNNFYSFENKNIQDIYLQTLIKVKKDGRGHKKKHRKYKF